MEPVRKQANKKVGAAPGSLIFVGTRRTERVTIDVIRYDPDHFENLEDVAVSDVEHSPDSESMTWINVTGLHDIDVIRELGEKFDLHDLFLEDVLNPEQRAKFDVYDHFNAFFIRMMRLDDARGKVEMEQVAIAFGKNFLISFQESERDVFDTVRDRLLRATTKIRTRGTDYLAFALMDAIVDNYIVSIEYFGNKVEKLEDELLRDVREEHLLRINSYKREVNGLRRVVRPVLELATRYHKSESPLISSRTKPFIKDLLDHVIQATEAIEIYKELLNDELGFYHTTMSDRLNEIIRVLTIFSVIFIPITFLAGVYGTNFHYIPELDERWAYPVFWAIMIGVSGLMLWYFHRKGWLR